MRSRNPRRHPGTDGTSVGSARRSAGGRCDLTGIDTPMPSLPRCIPRNLDQWIEFACAYVISLFVLLLLWGFLGPLFELSELLHLMSSISLFHG